MTLRSWRQASGEGSSVTKRRLLVVSPLDIFPPNTGGMRRTYNIIKSLLPRYDVALACPVLSQPEEQDLPIRVYQLTRPGKRQFLSPRFVRRLRHVIEHEEPEALIVSFIWAVPAAWLARFPKRIPLYVDTQNVETERLRGAGARWWRLAAVYERLATHLVDRVWVVSGQDLNLLRQLGMPERRAVLVPNGYDNEVFFPDLNAGRAMRESLGITAGERLLLYFGHMGYGPNQEALEALYKHVLPILDRQQIKYRLVVAGRNSSELAGSYIHQHMLFTGVIDRIQDAINAADAVVVPLLRGGGTRTKIIESAACGTPVVSTTAGAAGLDRAAFGELLTIADDWGEFASATVALAARPREDRVQPPGFCKQYAWRSVMERLELDAA